MCTYNFVVFEWWEGETHPGGMYSGLIRARNQSDARKKALWESGFTNDERAVRVVAHAWRNRSMKRVPTYIMDLKK